MRLAMSKSLWESLSPREQDVLRCIVMGQKRELTCIGLGISGPSYDGKRQNLMEKLGVQTDVDLVWVTLKQGWVAIRPVVSIPMWIGGNRVAEEPIRIEK